MNQRALLRLIKFFVYAAVALTPLFFLSDTVYPAIISKTAFLQALTEAAFFLWLALAFADKRYRPKLNFPFLALIAFLAVMLLASAFGADPSRSFWSTYERMFGAATVLHLAAFAVVIASVFSFTDRRRLLWVSAITSSAVSVIAILQTRWNQILAFENLLGSVSVRAGSTFDNPSFLAGYLLFNLFFAMYLFAASGARGAPAGSGFLRGFLRRARRIFLAAILAVDFWALFITQTRAALIAFVCGFLLMLLMLAFRPPVAGRIFSSRKFYLGLLVFIVASGSVFWLTRQSGFWSRLPALGRFKDLSFSSVAKEFTPRLIALNAAARGFLEKPILGWGPENFNIVFNKYYDPRALELNYVETRFDKPHNFFMELLVTGGILLAAAFLAFIISLFRAAHRSRDRLWGQMAAAALAAYVVQNLFIFDTLGPAMMFYLLAGLFMMEGDAMPVCEIGGSHAQENHGLHAPRGKIKPSILAATVVPAVIIIYAVNFLTVKAAYEEYWGFQYLANGRVQEGIGAFRGALHAWSPYRWNFVRDYATAMSQAYFYNGNVVPPDEVSWAVSEMEKVKDEHPLDAFNHYLLVDIYNQSSAINPTEYLARAEKEAAIALELSPNRQEVYFSLSKTKYLEGKPDEALKLLKYALDLDPNVPDAHFYYGIMSYATGDTATGYNEIEKSITMGRKWAIFYEPRTVAGLFADNGHPDEAIKIYEEALAMQPNDTETEIKLGAAYFIFKNDKENARKYLLAAAKKFDFKSSPSYSQLKPILDALGISQ